ncbi:ketopantoate hydroxymethyltransferase [Dacryopinax primogenitus]|uniref:3-methyl-2-oxobutanoate hydroxymethyltransferase n=1 Tax=Dacryopinax primogenitus (strain DJM 731) TaxID=1858805 RepID=M5FQF8_DACPD|nr:ketopantoate hydroxymethyltransferase [Dacryopinax primogenitus]EJT96959.1 ketopantoate hydroxymethyltransferase [Dacryopinax primogenitus]
MLTAYDYPSARRTEHGDIDICLVGDSLAQVALGYDSTTRLTLDEMLYHCRAVARGAKNPLLVADMPFGTYQLGPRDALDAAVRMVREGMMEGVKLEGGEEILDTVRVLTGLGIPVMGHIGLLPQRHASLSGYKVQGKNVEDALSIARAAKALEQAGAFSIVLEAIPSPLAAHITSSLHIPTIGIGAGAQCSGQVLVQDDALSVWSAGHKAKFVRRFAQVGQEAQRGVDGYARAVRSGDFPADEEGYGMSESVFDKFKDALGKEGESSMMATS